MAGNGIHIAEGGAPTGALSAADWRDYWSLLKPRVMTLVVFTGACGLFAAPGHLPPFLAFVAILCMVGGAGYRFGQYLAHVDTTAGHAVAEA